MTEIGKTITPDGGYSPQSTQNDSMTNLLSGITGGPAAQALAQASQAGPNYGATNLPQFSSDEDKLRTMFANDQALAGKYANPNTQAPAGNPAGFAASPLQQTADTVGGAGGMTTPGGLTGAVSNDISGQGDALGRIMSAFNFDQPRTLDAYKTMIGALTTLTNNEAQYGDSGSLLPTAGGPASDALELRKQYQSLYNKTTNFTQRDKIAKDFKTTTGYDLFPAKLSTSEQVTVNNTNKILTDLNWLKNTLDSGALDKYTGLIGGNYADLLSNPKTASLLPDDVHKALRIITQFKVLGERTAVGGRITGYLLDRLGPGFPDLAQGKSKVLSAITDAMENATTNMESLANQKGYASLDEFPYYNLGSTAVDESGNLNTGGSSDTTGSSNSFKVGDYTVTPL